MSYCSIKNKNREIVLEIALSINKELFEDSKISYRTFKQVELNILRELKEYKGNRT